MLWIAEKNYPSIKSNAQACQFTVYFSDKIEQIHSDIFYQNCNTLDIDINCNTLDIDINVIKSSCASKFRKFEPLSLAGLKATI